MFVKGDSAGADAMQAQLEALIADGKPPYISLPVIDDGKHIVKAALFCKRFFFKPGEGIMCEANQVCPDEALKGMGCAATFFVDDETRPCRIISEENAGPCFGKVTPLADCAFKNIKPIIQ